MIYWRIQMNQPHGRGELVINSIELLNEKQPVIGTGEWDDFQCRNFKGEGSTPLKIGDIILVHEGKTPIALCKVISENFTHSVLTEKYVNLNFRKVLVLYFYDGDQTVKDNQGTLKRFVSAGKETWSFIHKWYQKINNDMDINKISALLKHKKQIILQGPPGTGKTRLAKELARKLTSKNAVKLDIDDIKVNLSIGQKIDSASNQHAYYSVIKMTDSNVVLKSKNTKDEGHYAKFNKIIEYYQELSMGIKVKAINSHDSYELAVAKHFFDNITKDNSKYNLIQFHPSYTYEDFVRGISVKSGDDGLEYIAENKVLAKIATEANENYWDSKKESSEVSYKNWIEEQFEEFKEEIENSINDSELYSLSEKVGISKVGIQYFKYVGNGWHDYIKYSGFLSLYFNKVFDRQSIKKFLKIDSRATYYAKLVEKFDAFLEEKEKPNSQNDSIPLKNYVLIIDEINRANLSSVLGELIYALEYRGEALESMYEVADEGNEIILPPNLFIIGTMNTADRSVGQIDYAIRRRFAFVDVLPKIIENSNLNLDRKETDKELKFAKNSFIEVSKLFVKNDIETITEHTILEPSDHLIDEFRPKDVWLGHSYFILEKDGDFNMNFDYEIAPILKEYVADGILKESALEEIENIRLAIQNA